MTVSLDVLSDPLTAVQVLAGGGVVVARWSNMFESLLKSQQVGRSVRGVICVKYVKLLHNYSASTCMVDIFDP